VKPKNSSTSSRRHTSFDQRHAKRRRGNLSLQITRLWDEKKERGGQVVNKSGKTFQPKAILFTGGQPNFQVVKILGMDRGTIEKIRVYRD